MLAFDLGPESGSAASWGSSTAAACNSTSCTASPMVRCANHRYAALGRAFSLSEMLAAWRKPARPTAGSTLSASIPGVSRLCLPRVGVGRPFGQSTALSASPHTEGIMHEAFKRVGQSDIYIRRTGLQLHSVSTRSFSCWPCSAIVRLCSNARNLSCWISDLFTTTYFTGVKADRVPPTPPRRKCSIQLRASGPGSGSGVWRARQNPGKPGGTRAVLGAITRWNWPARRALKPMLVIAPATHDTGSAVAAVPAAADKS